MNIIDEILAALQTEDRVMLATIIKTSGSTPASAFSKMLVKNDGIVSVGTVGGGCMEGDVILHANRLLQSGRAEILSFHLNEDDIEHGLICGGALDVLIEPITKKQIPLVENLRTFYNEGEDCIVVTELKRTGEAGGKYILSGSPGSKISGRVTSEQELAEKFPEIMNFSESIRSVYRRKQTVRLEIEDGELILEPFNAAPSLIIFGGGHVSKFLSRTASMAGFRVTVVDDREKYANKERFPDAVRTVSMDFLEAFHQFDIRSSSYVVIVTRGHSFDEEILEQVLKTPARYIGMIGSKRKVLTIFEHLHARGITIDELRRVHAPMGIEIGALTAEEIAISIVAQLINVRRDSPLTIHYKSDETRILLQTLEPKTLIA